MTPAWWAPLGNRIVKPRWRSRLRWAGYERLALWLDVVAGGDTP